MNEEVKEYFSPEDEIQENNSPTKNKQKLDQITSGNDDEKVLTDERMRAVFLTDFGNTRFLKVETMVSLPVITADQILIRVYYCGINFEDMMVINGRIKSFQKPVAMGSECAGEVISVGDNVKEFQVGDRVVAFPSSGGWADYVRVKEHLAFKLPPDMLYKEAASITLTYLSAYIMLFEIALILPHKVILIHSVAGATGEALVRLSRIVDNVTIIGLCNKTKLGVMKDTGLIDHLFDRKEEYWTEIKKLYPEGVDLIFDSMGGKDTDKSYPLLKTGGTYFFHGNKNNYLDETKHLKPNDRKKIKNQKFNFNKYVDKNNNNVIFDIKSYLDRDSDNTNMKHYVDTIFTLWVFDFIHPNTDNPWNIEHIDRAMEYLNSGANIGKLVLKLLSEEKPRESSKTTSSTVECECNDCCSVKHIIEAEKLCLGRNLLKVKLTRKELPSTETLLDARMEDDKSFNPIVKFEFKNEIKCEFFIILFNELRKLLNLNRYLNILSA